MEQSDDIKSTKSKYFKNQRKSLVVIFVISTIGFTWLNEHRPARWLQTINPMYWMHRFRGDDLYITETALMLHGNRSLKEIALTFDDGPHRGSCEQILQVLRKHKVHATFFEVGTRMEENPDLLLQTIQDGNEAANHSQNHIRLINLDKNRLHREINDADIIYNSITGRHFNLLRPPGMRYNDTVLLSTRNLGYVVVGYTTASRDYEPDEQPSIIAQRTLDRTENGSIILLHDYTSTAQALPQIIESLQKDGYKFVTISEMLAHLPVNPAKAAASYIAQYKN